MSWGKALRARICTQLLLAAIALLMAHFAAAQSYHITATLLNDLAEDASIEQARSSALDGTPQKQPAVSQAAVSQPAVRQPSVSQLEHSGKGAAWYRIQLDALPVEPLLVARNSLGASLTLYFADGTTMTQKRGELALKYPEYSAHNLVFPLFELGSERVLYLKALNPTRQPLLLTLYAKSDYLSYDAQSTRFLNVCLGVLLAFSVLGFVFFGVIGDRTSLYLAFGLLGNLLYLCFMLGEAAHWIGLRGLWPWWIDATVFAALVSLLFVTEFYIRLLDLPQILPRLCRVLRWHYLWAGIIVVICVIDLINRQGERGEIAALASASGNFLIVSATLFVTVAIMIACFKHQSQAHVVLLAAFVNLLGNALRASQFALGWAWLEWAWALQVAGMTIASSLMAYALMDRFIGLRDERDRAHNAATHDPLTGALNRLGGLTEGNRLLANARRQKRDFAVAILDLDHFKQVNDRFGHGVGDLALKLFVSVVQEQLAGEEKLMRMGGEEFALMLPNLNQDRALHRLNTLRLAVQQAGVTISSQPVCLTVSIGLAQLQAHHQSVDALLNDADQALYLAKNSGRNRAVAFTHATATAQPGDSHGTKQLA